MIIQSKRVYYDELIAPRQIKIENGKIVGVYPYGLFAADEDYGDHLIMPGLIDIHNHGYDRGDNNHATSEWLRHWTKYLLSEGVTSTLATISSAPYETLLESLEVIGEFIKKENSDTEILGVYSEGPFISTDFRGAQSLECKIVPTKEVIDAFDEACGHELKLVMLAPEELAGDYSVIKYCVDNGIKVSLGHTGATFKICEEAIENGASSFTHTFNGMRGLHHREPGVVGAAMIHEECYAELICDGVHVNKVPAKILAEMKGKDHLILITDSVAIKGMKPGIYKSEDRTTIVGEDGVGRLEDGTLAGSCNKLNKVLQFAIKSAKISTVTAMNAVTINPCRMLGINDKGLIADGYDADIAVFDEEFEPVAVYKRGRCLLHR